MTAISVLRSEHEAILRMIEAIEIMARRIQHSRPVPPAAIAAATEWLSIFAHRIHRDKEEDVLFPLLRSKGLGEGPGCIGALLAAHDEGREAFKRMLVSMAEGDQPSWASAVWAYSQMMRLHIRREDEVAFRLADELLSDEEQLAMAQGFAQIDDKAHLCELDECIGEAERIVQQVVAQPSVA
jgi:hemerythrin-like domain-containing protein